MQHNLLFCVCPGNLAISVALLLTYRPLKSDFSIQVLNHIEYAIIKIKRITTEKTLWCVPVEIFMIN